MDRKFVIIPQWCVDVEKSCAGWIYRKWNPGPTDQSYHYYKYDSNYAKYYDAMR